MGELDLINGILVAHIQFLTLDRPQGDQIQIIFEVSSQHIACLSEALSFLKLNTVDHGLHCDRALFCTILSVKEFYHTVTA
jgi:hypothetical protein